MDAEIANRQKLRAYLLGTLSEDERDKLAERYFVDQALYEELLEVETDLIDEYARGQLPAEDRQRLESYLKSLPDGQHKVAVARALVAVISEERAAATLKPEPRPPAAAVVPVSETVGLWQTLAAWLTQPIPALAMMVTGLVVLSALTWLLLRNQQLRRDNQELRAQAEQGKSQQEQLQRQMHDLERKMTDQQNLTAQLQQDLQREKQLREAQAQALAPSLPSPITPWLLSDAATRNPTQPFDTVRLNAKAKTVALTIPVKGNEKYTGYEVELKTADGKQLLWKDSWPTTPPRTGPSIVFPRPASQFTETNYKLTLTLISAHEKKTRDYYFTVVKQ